MSQPQYGSAMDRPSAAGSVKRARERAQAAAMNQDPRSQLPSMRVQGPDSSPDTSPRRAPPSGPSRIPRLQGPNGSPSRDGPTGPISRPTQIPQWPLPGPIPSPVSNSGTEPYRPPPGRSQPPQRPPRPSQVPSILDGSRIQDPTPTFQYQPPQPSRDSTNSQDFPGSVPPTPSSRQTISSVSSVGSIPDFPMPSAMPPSVPPPTLAPPRRSVNLGPPPSSRRGASSFYSNASLVSPIPEESPRSRSHGSYASSAAMPESWGTASPPLSPDQDRHYYDDVIAEESSFKSQTPIEDDDDESKLVRSASIGKRGKPALVMNRRGSGEQSTGLKAPEPSQSPSPRPSPSPLQNRNDPFQGGTGYLDVSSGSSGTLPTRANPNRASLTADAMLGAYAAASASGPADMPRPSPTPSPQPYSRLSAIRRPPKLGLDIDAVRDMEARGSMTSLPDLIKRATRLAAMMDRGKRPASRFDNIEWPDEKDLEKERSLDDRHRSGLSDMLAAFPPPAGTPAQNRPARGSWFRRSTSSWPLAPVGDEDLRARGDLGPSGGSSADGKKRRRCCGLPLWAFILIAVLVVLIVAAAIAVPLYFFVFREDGNNQNNTAEPILTECQTQLRCENGGTNVVARGVCSCICTNGFTGSTCAVGGATGCTTTNLVLMAQEGDITNVTLGQAMPRLIQQAQTNFTVPLMGTTILAKFNQESLSCIAQNSLVTFDGRATRTGIPTAEVVIDDDEDGSDNSDTELDGQFAEIATITVPALEVMTTMIGTVTVTTTITSFPAPNPTEMVTSSIPTPSSVVPPPPTATFTVTEEVLDFARVTVLYILQERDLSSATGAQSNLQRFFAMASRGGNRNGDGITVEMATSVSLVDGISVDLVNFLINISGTITGRVDRSS